MRITRQFDFGFEDRLHRAAPFAFLIPPPDLKLPVSAEYNYYKQYIAVIINSTSLSPTTHEPQQPSCPKPMSKQRTANLMVAGGITIFALAMGAYPFYEVQKHKAEANSLSEKEGALSGSQIQRGQYINTGSQDIGRDPDWDFKEHKWRGKRVKIEK